MRACVNILKKKSPADGEKIKRLSDEIGKKLSQSPEAKKIEKLSDEELQDLGKILQMADYILCKNEDRKRVYSIMKEFVEMIKDSAESVSCLDDEISEMVLAAEDSLKRIKGIQCRVSENYAFDSKQRPTNQEEPQKKGSINLTNTSTPIYTQEYQPSSTLEAEQVI